MKIFEALILVLVSLLQSCVSNSHDYCVIGAGPSGTFLFFISTFLSHHFNLYLTQKTVIRLGSCWIHRFFLCKLNGKMRRWKLCATVKLVGFALELNVSLVTKIDIVVQHLPSHLSAISWKRQVQSITMENCLQRSCKRKILGQDVTVASDHLISCL